MVALLRTLFGLVLAPLLVRFVVLLGRLQGHGAMRRYTRRTFLRNTVLGSVIVVLAQIAGGFVYFFWPNKTSAFGTEITVPASAIPAVGAAPYVNQAGKFYIINNEDGALALYWKCPHLGCTVPWNETEGDFHCPCHGSIYDRHGVRIAGPAPRPMDLMSMTQDASGNVIVNTGNISERSGYSPDQALKLR
ncbi:MAG: cytochrome B6 [Chloroflexi bacterium]|nr:MAG: cytochrome B6 [Chloroflexota bacterium]